MLAQFLLFSSEQSKNKTTKPMIEYESLVTLDDAWIVDSRGIHVRKGVKHIVPLRNYLPRERVMTDAEMNSLRTGWPEVYGEHRTAVPALIPTPMLTQAEDKWVAAQAAARFPYSWKRTADHARQYGKACFDRVCLIFSSAA